MKSRNYSESEKFAAVERFLVGGESVATIAADTGISRSTLYAWIKSAQIEPGMLEFTRKNFRMLEAKVKRLEGIVEILQIVNCTANAPLNEKLRPRVLLLPPQFLTNYINSFTLKSSTFLQKCFLCRMDHKIAFVRIGFRKVNLIPLACLAEVGNIGQIFFCWRPDIAVRRSNRVQFQIFFVLHLSDLLQVLSK